MERKRASGVHRVERWKQRETGVEMRAAGSLREIRGDEWIGVTNTRTLSSADVVPTESYSGREFARGERSKQKAEEQSRCCFLRFATAFLSPLSFIPFFSPSASSTSVVNFDSILRLIRASDFYAACEGNIWNRINF